MKRAHRSKKSTTKLNRLPVAALKADAVSIATEFVQALEIAAAVAADTSTEINDAPCDDDKESGGGASVMAAAPQPLSLLHRLHGLFLSCPTEVGCQRAAEGAAAEERALPLLEACAELCTSGDAMAYIGAGVLQYFALVPRLALFIVAGKPQKQTGNAWGKIEGRSDKEKFESDGVALAVLHGVMPFEAVQSPLYVGCMGILLATTARETPATTTPFASTSALRSLLRCWYATFEQETAGGSHESQADASKGDGDALVGVSTSRALSHAIAEARVGLLQIILRAARAVHGRSRHRVATYLCDSSIGLGNVDGWRNGRSEDGASVAIEAFKFRHSPSRASGERSTFPSSSGECITELVGDNRKADHGCEDEPKREGALLTDLRLHGIALLDCLQGIVTRALDPTSPSCLRIRDKPQDAPAPESDTDTLQAGRTLEEKSATNAVFTSHTPKVSDDSMSRPSSVVSPSSSSTTKATERLALLHAKESARVAELRQRIAELELQAEQETMARASEESGQENEVTSSQSTVTAPITGSIYGVSADETANPAYNSEITVPQATPFDTCSGNSNVNGSRSDNHGSVSSSEAQPKFVSESFVDQKEKVPLRQRKSSSKKSQGRDAPRASAVLQETRQGVSIQADLELLCRRKSSPDMFSITATIAHAPSPTINGAGNLIDDASKEALGTSIAEPKPKPKRKIARKAAAKASASLQDRT